MNANTELNLRTEWPQAVKTELETIVPELRQALGSQCVAMVLYGGAAKGEFITGQSDLNLLLVVDRVTVDLLSRVAPILQRGAAAARTGVLILTEEELRSSTDVFPTKFLDIQRQHHLLAGRDPFAGLSIGRDHLRLRCEQELKNLMLRLRQLYLERVRRPELLETALLRSISPLISNLGILAELKTGIASPTKEAAIEHAEKLGLAVGPVRQALALKRGDLKLEAAGLKELFGAFMQTVEEAARKADEMEGGKK
jgi:hypothetical protein